MSGGTKKTSGIRLRSQIPSRDQLAVQDGITISVTQAYCPGGHKLIRDDNWLFQGQPGIRLAVAQGGEHEDVTLSPIHGHHARHGGEDFEYGRSCSVTCPTCRVELPAHEEACLCGRGKLRIIYLTTWLDQGDVAMVCDVWGCQRSRVLDKFELLSEWVEEEDE